MQDDGEEEPITLYFWPTPNGLKISIMLEELAVPYRFEFIDLSKGAQFAPEFLAISPNNKMPAIVDPDGPDGQPLALFESGAILQYLGRKFGAFYPSSERAKADVDQWLFWQVGGSVRRLGRAIISASMRLRKFPTPSIVIRKRSNDFSA